MIPLFLSSFSKPVLFGMAALFAGIALVAWLYLRKLNHKVIGTPGRNERLGSEANRVYRGSCDKPGLSLDSQPSRQVSLHSNPGVSSA